MELLLIFLSTGVISYVTAFFLSKYRILDNGGLSLIASILCGATAVSFTTSFPLSYYSVFPLLVAGIGLGFSSVKEGRVPLWGLTVILCFLASLFFMPEYLVFQGMLPFWADRAISSIFWAAFVLMFYRFTENTNFGIVQMQAIVLAFLALGSISSSLFLGQFMMYDIVLCGSVIGYLLIKRRTPMMEVGRAGALFIGFILGGFFFVRALLGGWASFVVMPMFLFLDYLHAGFQIIRAHLTKKTYPLFYFLPKFNGLDATFPPFLMKRMIIVALLGVLLQTVDISLKTMGTITVFSIFIIFLDTVMKIENWGKPKIRMRDLARDIRDASKEIHSQLKKGMKKLKKDSK